MSPAHVWQLSMYPLSPMPSFFSLLAKWGDFSTGEKKKKRDWHWDAAVWILFFILISLLYFREVEGLSLQSQLYYKIENKFAVYQVSSKKEMHGIYCTLLCMNMHLGNYQKIWGSSYSRLIYLRVHFKNQSRRIVLHSLTTRSGRGCIPTSHINSFPFSNTTGRDPWQMYVAALGFLALL